jgi:putative sugar O-methyltransferase
MQLAGLRSKAHRAWMIYGFLGAVQEFLIRRTCYSIQDYSFEPDAKSTSISDQNPYVKICNLAVSNDEIFSKFRRCHEYRLILEHVTKRFGKQYLALAMKNANALEYYKKIEPQNKIGSPVTLRFKEIGYSSPTTIRYLKVLIQLIELFGQLDDKVICEIGVGFGGQAHAITVNQKVKKYVLYDLPPVLELNKKFLGAIGTLSRFEFIDGRYPSERNSDLLISNYAFSELTRDVQLMYLERVILKAKSGYITWNELSYIELDGLSVEELLRTIPNSFLIPEEPNTYTNNVIIVWGATKNF